MGPGYSGPSDYRVSRHVHLDNGTVEGCPGCFPPPYASPPALSIDGKEREAQRKMALGFGEVSNIAAEALTLLESRAVSAWLREVHRVTVAELRARLEAACRSVS
jgi:hypothetical protein